MDQETTSAAADENGEKPPIYRDWCRFIVDLLLFYTTAFFVLLAIFSLFALVFLVPFFIDPAWSTLQADFDPNGTQCSTFSSLYLEGRSLCEWSSCEEGCTKTIFTCWQILVEYELPGVSPGNGMEMPKAKGRLYPNVKGCGYPPVVDCQSFIGKYGVNHTQYTCYVSRTDPSLVVVDLDLDEVKMHLFYSLAIPIPCLIISTFYLIIAYKFIYSDKRKEEAFNAAALKEMDQDSKEISGDLQDSEKDKQRKLLMQIQKTKWLAQHGKLGSDSSNSSHGLDLTKFSCIRLKELQESQLLTLQPFTLELEQQQPDVHTERMQKDRQSYTSEKTKVLHYYQCYSSEI